MIDFFKVWFRHNQFEKPQFGQITQLQFTNIEGYGGRSAPSAWRFLQIYY